MYLSIAMDLYSRRIIGWAISSRMTTDLILQSLRQAYWLRKRPKGVMLTVFVALSTPANDWGKS